MEDYWRTFVWGEFWGTQGGRAAFRDTGISSVSRAHQNVHVYSVVCRVHPQIIPDAPTREGIAIPSFGGSDILYRVDNSL